MTLSTSRRTFLSAAGSLVGGILLNPTVGGAAGLTSPERLITANWLTAENQRAGDSTWLLGQAAPAGALEGYASATSVNLGATISFFVSTNSPTLSAKVYRMGYYQGHGARLVEKLSGIPGAVRSIPSPDAYGTVDCNWPTTLTLNITSRYVAGQYLVRIENDKGHFRFVPFMVRDDASRAAFVYMSSVTTWQAYNRWGGLQSLRQVQPARNCNPEQYSAGGTCVLQPTLRSIIRQRGSRLHW